MSKQFLATLERNGRQLRFKVHAQPAEWRTPPTQVSLNFTARHGGRVASCLYPELCGSRTVYLRGAVGDRDHATVTRDYASEDAAINAFYDYDRSLREFVHAAMIEGRRAMFDLRCGVSYASDLTGRETWRIAKYVVEEKR